MTRFQANATIVGISCVLTVAARSPWSTGWVDWLVVAVQGVLLWSLIDAGRQGWHKKSRR